MKEHVRLPSATEVGIKPASYKLAKLLRNQIGKTYQET